MRCHSRTRPSRRGTYRFVHREYLIITYRTDPDRLRAFVPEPLAIDGPLVSYEFIRMPDSTGFGDYTESGQVIPVALDGRPGSYTHCMFLDDESPIAGGRELWDCLLTVALSSMGLYLTFRPGDIVAEMPISKQLQTEKSRRAAGLFFRGLSALMVIAGMYLLMYIAPAVASYSLGWAAAVKEVHVIRQVRSPAVPGAAYAYMSILTDDKKYLSFSYPDQILQVGHKYIFTLLPNSNFILAAQLAD